MTSFAANRLQQSRQLIIGNRGLHAGRGFGFLNPSYGNGYELGSEWAVTLQDAAIFLPYSKRMRKSESTVSRRCDIWCNLANVVLTTPTCYSFLTAIEAMFFSEKLFLRSQPMLYRVRQNHDETKLTRLTNVFR